MHAAEHHVLGAGPGGGLARQLEGVAGHVGELDDFVPLVVMAENQGAVTERNPGLPCAADQGWVRSRWQLTRAGHATLRFGIGACAEQEQRERTAAGRLVR